MSVESAPVPDTIDGLRRQNGALRTLNRSLESEIASHRVKARKYWEATQTLDSEREANAILTAEVAELREKLAYLEREARRFAGHYPQGTDGRNTFVIFADKIASCAQVDPLNSPQATEVKA